MLCDLSVVVVNYNVRYFLEYCLLSVRKASADLRVQVIVVDNASSDGDYRWLAERFPEVIFKQNAQNQGFGKANNQGLSLADGEFVLFLNPDTIVPENALRECVDFFRKTNDCGALGVYMMDGKGHFLPESKRSNPTPAVSFYKLSGLEKLFPRSKVFGQYALGYLDENRTFPVPILAGAFLMARKSLLEKVGGFDEAFFMYGEDIDLSFRLQNNTGFRNYFLGTVKILHFKGESSKQDSLHYNKIFNDAMGVFVRKYHSNIKASLMHGSIRLGTSLRAIALKGKRKKEKGKNGADIGGLFLEGDADVKAILMPKLRQKMPTAPLSNTIDAAENIVFCIGENYAFEKSLEDLSQYSNDKNFYWFDPKINTIIGSNDKNETGVVWKL